MALVVDTSAFAALYKGEPGSQAIVSALNWTDRAIIPATCMVEAALLRRLGPEFQPWFWSLIAEPQFELAEISLPIARLAATAARNYGKGSGHSAQLNFGDCFSYAVAKHRDLPLLFVGADFARTDVIPALPQD